MKYLLWDFDGTLAFSRGMWTGTVATLLQRHSITHIRQEDIRPLLSKGFPWHSPDISHASLFAGKSWWEYMEDYFRRVFLSLHIDITTAYLLSQHIKSEYMRYDHWFLYDDVLPTLKECLQLGYSNIILSNHIPELTEIIALLGVEKYFLSIYSSGNIGFEKPNKKIFEFVMEDMNIHSRDCIMIGDSYEADARGALGVGMEAILVRKSNDTSYTYYCNTIEQIPHLVDIIRKKSHNIT